MKKNSLKDKMRAGQAVVGPIMGFDAPYLVELFAYSGFDFVIFDGEHGPLGEGSCENLVRAAEAAGIASIMRCPQNTPQVILRYADTGVLGLQIPQINTLDDAHSAVRSVKYFPLGERGLAGSRAHAYGALAPLGESIKIANEESMIIAHIENVQAVQNIKELLTEDGIDVWFIGTSDLSQSMGIPAQLQHPELLSTVDMLIDEIRSAGRIAGIVARNGEDARKYMERGCQYIIVNAASLILSGARQFERQARG